jgi:hypothetical protein
MSTMQYASIASSAKDHRTYCSLQFPCRTAFNTSAERTEFEDNQRSVKINKDALRIN